MDWQKQMEEAMTGWTDTQRKLWDQWFETLRGAGMGHSLQDAQKQQFEAWEKAVSEALERQEQWVRSLSGATTTDDGSNQMQQMMRAWTETQGELWRTWLSRMEESQPAVRDMPWYRSAREVLDAWEQAISHASNAASGGAGSKE